MRPSESDAGRRTTAACSFKRSPDVYVDVSGRAPEQIVIRPTLLDAARDMLQHGGRLAQKLGLTRIEVTPLKLGGQPSVRGRRWTVDSRRATRGRR